MSFISACLPLFCRQLASVYPADARQGAMYIGVSRIWLWRGRLEKGGLLFQGSDIYEILKRIGVTHLHHANSVITSCTYLEQGGIVSRGFAEDHGLQQSSQPTDELDKKYGIWHTIFVPHVDIHDRQG